MSENVLIIQILIFQKYETIFRLVLHLAGLLGSLIMFAVYLQPNLRQLSVSIYFRWLAIFCALDNSYFIYSVIDRLTSAPKISSLICKFSYFLLNFLGSCTVWFEVVAGFDRCLTIVVPLKCRFIQKLWFKRIVVLATIFYNMAFYSIDLIFYDVVINVSQNITYHKCKIENESVFFILKFLNSSAIPFVLMLGLTILTFIGVLRAHKKIRSNIAIEQAARIRRKDIKFGITIIFSNILFFILSFVRSLFLVLKLNLFNRNDSFVSIFVFQAALNDSVYVYYATIFYAQLVVNSLVRKELGNLIKRGWFRIFKE